MFSWLCKGCKTSVRTDEQVRARIITDGEVVAEQMGAYDGYGRVGGGDGEEFYDKQWWHERCLHEYKGDSLKAGNSSHAPDQGFPESRRRYMTKTASARYAARTRENWKLRKMMRAAGKNWLDREAREAFFMEGLEKLRKQAAKR